jgi:hypothetical protein
VVRFAVILCLAGCSSLLGIGDLAGPSDGGSTPPPDDGPQGPALDCKAQRTVHIVAGSGGLAWFTLIWPVPGVIKFFMPTYAYDDPGLTKNLTTDLAHELFIRKNGAVGVWEGKGTHPQPSIFLAGTNETHTQSPISTITSGGTGLLAAAAAIQVSALAPPVPVLAFDRSTPYGNAMGAPAVMQVSDVDPAISALQAQGVINAAAVPALRPASAQLARYFSMGAPPVVVSLGTRLAFTANALKMGLFGSVMIPAFNDDPHNAFATGGAATVRANQLATLLDAFYADLGTGNELDCGKGGQPLSLADNVVLMVTGDTMKDSYVNNLWPDGTAQNANVMYLRSNGFTKPGWFGELQPGNIRLFFDPMTGQSGSGTAQGDTDAAFAGALYAIARGDRMRIAPFASAPFDGLIGN